MGTPEQIILATLQVEGPSSTYTLTHQVMKLCRGRKDGLKMTYSEAATEVVDSISALVRSARVVGDKGRWSLPKESSCAV